MLEDYRAGQVAYMVYLANRDSSKGGEALTIESFMPTAPKQKAPDLQPEALSFLIEKLAAGEL